jgi:hypothetical protein
MSLTTLETRLIAVLKQILADDESNRASCPCGAKHVKVTRQRQAWDVIQEAEKKSTEKKR